MAQLLMTAADYLAWEQAQTERHEYIDGQLRARMPVEDRHVTVAGNPAAPHGINAEGLRRRGFSSEAIAAIRRAYKLLYRSGLTLTEARERIAELAVEQPELQPLIDFLAQPGRGIVR